MDIYLKARTESALYKALEAAGIVRETEDGYGVTDGHKYAIDVIGKDSVATYFNGTIRRIAYYPVRLADTTLQALTG